jgi:hypothetical protein
MFAIDPLRTFRADATSCPESTCTKWYHSREAIVALRLNSCFNDHMWAFGKAVLSGSLVGAAPVLALTLLLAASSLPDGINGSGSLPATLWLAILPLAVSFPVVFITSLVIGLPLTYFLRRNGWESNAAYVGVGVTAGFVIPVAGLLMMAAGAGYWIALLGAASGAATGHVWWSSARKPLSR